MIARWLRALAAVVAGNALYFLLVDSALPVTLLHRPFAIDAGLGLDFLICLAVFLAIGGLPGVRRRR